MESNDNHRFCRHRALPGKMRDHFAFVNPLSVDYLSFNNVCFTGGISLLCKLCTQRQWPQFSVLPSVQRRLQYLRSSSWRVITIQDFVLSRGIWEMGRSDLHLILTVKFTAAKTLFHLSRCLSVGARKQGGCRSRVKSIIFRGITIIWCEESKATSV